MCFHAEKRIAGIGRGRLSGMATVHCSRRSLRLASSVHCSLFTVHGEAYDGSQQKIPMMFPGCFHGKGKD